MSDQLSALMNAMIGRLEFTQKEALGTVPEDKIWGMLQYYVAVDDVLAQLYKQYCDAKDGLSRLTIDKGADDPMTEIAWDMHDSARCAVETRLIELKENDDVTERALRLKSLHSIPKNEYARSPSLPSRADDMDQAIVFMLWASMTMKSCLRRQDVKRDFGQAA